MPSRPGLCYHYNEGPAGTWKVRLVWELVVVAEVTVGMKTRAAADMGAAGAWVVGFWLLVRELLSCIHN